MSERVKEVVVIGAGILKIFQYPSLEGESPDRVGVVGLTTAIRIQEHGGYHVTIVAETIPGDTKSIRYTSPWAVRFFPPLIVVLDASDYFLGGSPCERSVWRPQTQA
jgi:hypothetical protein